MHISKYLILLILRPFFSEIYWDISGLALILPSWRVNRRRLKAHTPLAGWSSKFQLRIEKGDTFMKSDKRINGSLGIWAVAFLLFGIILCTGSEAKADPITVTIYDNFNVNQLPYSFSNPIGTFSAEDVMFASNTGFNWKPYGEWNFGAIISGTLYTAGNGIYSFSLNSDDGSLLYIDNQLVINNGGSHGPKTESADVFLAQVPHSFEIQFFDVGWQGGVDLYLSEGVGYSPIPEPTSLLLLGTGLASLAFLRRKK
jgi:hypothetical protein